MALRGRLRKRLEDAYEKASRTHDEHKTTPIGNNPPPIAIRPEAGLARAH
jgi:hypothetical protein